MWVTSNYDWLETKRRIFWELLNNRELDNLYITLDEISQRIGHELYPLLYEELINMIKTATQKLNNLILQQVDKIKPVLTKYFDRTI